jgi:hypothetical protein
MWDGLNPKPIASERMADAVPGLAADLETARSGTWSSRVRMRLESECSARGMKLVDAF